VMGQCCATFERLKRSSTRFVLTSLNTHVDHLRNAVEDEHDRIGFSGPTLVHSAMQRRARREIELADQIRVLSKRAARTFVERGVPEHKLVVTHLPVDANHFHPVPPRQAPFRALCVSSIEPRKGVHYLLEAWEKVAIPNAELVLIGGAGDRWSRRMLDSYLSRLDGVRQVHMDVTRAPVEESYGAADVLVHPAIEDGYGLVIPQSLACGRPVIASSAAGAAELVRDGENGFVVPPRSVSDLVDRLRLLASDRNLRERMSLAAPQSVSHLTPSNYAREVLGIYDAVGRA
ncbi:MAG: glycosyltransferase family 4 protein, partial [Tepidisphaeraceae bacterium]